MMGFFDGGLGGAISGAGSLIGGLIGANNASNNAQFNYNAQKEFAQNGIRWRVEGAKAAGIHPLYALGASTSSFSPIQGYQGDYGISSALGQFGQGISRAAQAKMTKEEREREQARQEMQDTFQLAQMNKQNQLADAQINLINSEVARNKVASYVALMNTNKVPAMPTVGSSSPIPGQGDAPFVEKPIVRDGWLLDEKGRKISLIPGDAMKQRTEDVFGVEWFPFISSFYRDFQGRVLGREIAGHKWDPELGYIPVSQWNKRNGGSISVQTYEDYSRGRPFGFAGFR